MQRTTKIILWVVVIIIVIAGIWYGVSRKPTPTAKEPIKIGAILPLTGDSAFMGEGVKNAILLAQAELPESTRYKYEIIFEDDQGNPTITASAVNKLINIDKVNAIISFGSSAGNVVSPVAKENKVIHFGIASDPNVAKGEFNFIHWTQPEAEAKKFVEEVKRRGIKTMAFVGVKDAGVMAGWEVSKEMLQTEGIDIVAEEWFNFGEKDFKTIILKISQRNPEIIDIAAWSPELELFAKQLKELGIDIPLTTVEAFEFSEQLDLFEGYWYIQAAEPSDNFIDRYQERYNKNPNIGTANGYDIFNLIVAGFEKGGKDPEGVVRSLLEIKDFPGALGSLKIQENGIVWSDAVVKMIKDGKPVIIRK